LREKGHDGVIIEMENQFNSKRLNDMFGHDQVIDFELKKGDTINVKEFADKVKSELLPLKTMKDIGSNYNRGGKYESISLPKEIRGDVKNYKENVYQSPIKTSAGNIHFPNFENTNYFGHTRIEDMADNKTRRVIEVQSDLYQKGNLEREFLDKDAQGMKKYTEDYPDSPATPGYKEKYTETQNKLQKEKGKLQQYNDPTAHFRMVREEIKKAAQDGKTKLQFPTGETAMKIEGLGNETIWAYATDTNRRVMPDEIKVGMSIVENRLNGIGDEWIITEVLGDGKFKAVQKRVVLTPRDERGLGRNVVEKGGVRFNREAEESFDISGKVDTNNPIYRFYEKDVTKYLNKFGGKKVVDDKGVSWIEIPITAEQGINPVPAFKQATSETLRENLTPKEKELLNKEVSFKEVLPELTGLLNKIGVQTTVNIFDNIYTGGKNKDMTPEQAFGMYFDKELSLASRTTMFIHNHEVSHMVLENMDNMQIFKDKEITQSDVFNALREEYGNQSKAELDEILAVLVEKDAMNRYLKRKSDTRGVIKKYIDALLDFISDFLGNGKNLTLIETYIEVINGDKKYKTNKVSLSGTNKSQRYSIKPTEIQRTNAVFKTIETQNLNTVKDFLKKTIDNTIRKYSKETEVSKKEVASLKEELYKLADSIETEAGIFNVLKELRNYEVKEKAKSIY
jgi:hypothetical protein